MKDSLILGIKISNPDKILFPNQKISKLDIANYYKKVAKFMLPFVKERLLSVIKCHQTIDDCFYNKHPSIINKHINAYNDGKHQYFYIKTASDIIYQVQLGTTEFHIPCANVTNMEKPNYMVFDLDPDTNLSLNKLRQGVKHLKKILDNLNLKSFLKTSGGKGYHVVVPFKDCKNWRSFYNFAKQVALLMEKTWPDLYTTNIKKSKRKNKIFIDYLRNEKNSTCIAPYSVRARQNATVSMPISWTDLSKITPNQITIKTAGKYLEKSHIEWKDFFKVNQIIK